MTILIDSCVWIEYFTAKGSKARDLVESDEQKICSMINIFEVHNKLMKISDANTAEKAITYMNTSAKVYDVTQDLAKKASMLKNSFGTATADSIVAATCMMHKAELVSGDPDFKRITTLKFRQITK